MSVLMLPTKIKKCRAIIMFGPASDNDGFKLATYFQVTLDPSMVSPSGEYIRFGLNAGDELVGWQRIAALTVCEILGEYNADGSYPEANGSAESLSMMVVAKE